MGCQPTDIGEVHMIILELFFGNGSFSRAALDLGHEVTGVGIDPCPTDLVDRITYYQEDLSISPYISRDWEYGLYDFVWASPPCNTYSARGWSRKSPRRIDCKAVTEEARKADKLTEAAIYQIKRNGRGCIENPRACMRKQDFIQSFKRVTVTYCQYGHKRMKPTDLFFYPDIPLGFIPKACKNGDPCHIPSPRGSKGSSDATVPYDLCRELLELA